jgi:hypothetical protein
MNSNNNRGAILLLCGLLGGGALLLGYNLFVVPLEEYGAEIAQLEKENQEKEAKILGILRDRKKLKEWRALSLPGVESLPPVKGPRNAAQDREHALLLAQARYVDYLRELLRKHNVKIDETPRRRSADTKNVPKVNGDVPVFTPLQFSVDARGKLDNLVKMLDEFQSAPLLHRIRNFTIKQAPAAAGKAPAEPLVLSMVVEALIVNGAQKRGDSLIAVGRPPAALDAALVALRRTPTGLGLLPWPRLYAAAVAPKRNYTDIARKNIFEGAPKTVMVASEEDEKREIADLISKTYLWDVTITAPTSGTGKGSAQATVFNRLNERAIKVRALPGWNTIPLLKDGEGNTTVRGQVVRINARGLVFHVELFARDPEDEPSHLRYKKTDVIYSLDRSSTDALIKAKVIRPEEAARTYKVPSEYWQALLEDRVVRTGRGGDFTFHQDIVRGRVVKKDDDFVVIRLDEKYCSYRADRDERVRPHSGYCLLSIGESLTAALQTPLPEPEVIELKQTVAQRP